MFSWIASKWSVNDPLPEKVDLVVMISCGATPLKLTNGSREIMKLALCVAKNHGQVPIAWGSFSKNRTESERDIKLGSILPSQSLYVGPVSSTTDECEFIKKMLVDRKIPIRSIVVVTEGSHSRRAKFVWQYFFPNTDLYFRSVPPQKAGDPRNPMIFQRYWRVWLLVNILLFPLYLGDGARRMAKLNFSQPAT